MIEASSSKVYPSLIMESHLLGEGLKVEESTNQHL